MCRISLLAAVSALAVTACHYPTGLEGGTIEPPLATADLTGLTTGSKTINLRTDVHRSFILEKREFILGEPIVVELPTWPRHGEAVFQHIGGHSRMFGRNNNFTFLLLDAQGNWVPRPQPGGDRGGLISGREATSEEPWRIFQAVQRWCAIEKPGDYTLFCFYQEPIVMNRSTNKPRLGLASRDRPMVPHLPPELREWAKETNDFTFKDLVDTVPEHEFDAEFVGWDARWRDLERVESAHDLARFEIVIREASIAEQQAMVADWLRRIEDERAREPATNCLNQAESPLEAVYFSRQSCWLPTMAKWCVGGRVDFRNGMYVGLLLNPHVDATRTALSCSDKTLAYWDSWPQPGLLDRLARIIDDEGDDILRMRAATWNERLSPATLGAERGP